MSDEPTTGEPVALREHHRGDVRYVLCTDVRVLVIGSASSFWQGICLNENLRGQSHHDSMVAVAQADTDGTWRPRLEHWDGLVTEQEAEEFWSRQVQRAEQHVAEATRRGNHAMKVLARIRSASASGSTYGSEGGR